MEERILCTSYQQLQCWFTSVPNRNRERDWRPPTSWSSGAAYFPSLERVALPEPGELGSAALWVSGKTPCVFPSNRKTTKSNTAKNQQKMSAAAMFFICHRVYTGYSPAWYWVHRPTNRRKTDAPSL
ncbi:hypothetical protein GWK47_002426 [Chionoecetes opilio]|uniref:Uncharacterized protein n=1 Tax=Chionoecetes opilio TaxID=41210 RepID=A0A8J5CKB9_CHIOP|nr:hypothetical protein GWK47_002426 [Chionoecetes opilio]